MATHVSTAVAVSTQDSDDESETDSEEESMISYHSDASEESNAPGYKPTLRERWEELTVADGCIVFIEHADLICYILFLVCFTAMAILGRTAGDYNYTQTQSLRALLDHSMSNQDLTSDIIDIADIYTYFDEVLIPIVFRETRINGTFTNDPLDRYYINTHNARVLGGIRIKQVRWAKQRECEVAPLRFPFCFDEEAGTDKEEFAGNGHWAAVPFEYWDSNVLNDQTWTGQFGNYPGGGYVIDLLVSQGVENASLILGEMRDGEWLDAGTRAVFVDFNAFDPSTILHTVVRVAFEMPTGGIYASTEVKTWKFLRYDSGWGLSLSLMHVLFLLFIVGFTIQMGFEMYKDGVISLFAGETMTSYWSVSQWRKLDVVNMVVFYVLLGLFVRNDFYMQNLINVTSVDEFHSFRSLQFLFLGEVYCQAFAGFLLFVKAFKYLKIYPGFRFFYAMASASAPHLLVFFVVMGVFFLSFAILGFLLFGSDINDYRSFWASVANMLRYTVSDLDYSKLSASSPLWGSWFWFAWTLLMVFVLLNVFVGILAQAYTAAHDIMEEEDEQNDEDKSQKVVNIIQRFGAARIDELDDDGDGQISPKELAQVYPITVDEARAFIAHFDVDGDGELDQEEFQKLIEDQMNKKDAERKRKEQEEIERKERERQERIAMAKAAASGKTVSKKEFKRMRKQINEIYDLLEAVLEQTVDGARSVKRMKVKMGVPVAKHSRRRSRMKK